MQYTKRGMLTGFVALWLIGFVIAAPAPLYRLLFAQVNDVALDSPVAIFESADWSHPYYYQDIGRMFRRLSRQAVTDTIAVYFDPTSELNTDRYIRYFRENMIAWAYPNMIIRAGTLDEIPLGISIIVSTIETPPFDNCSIQEATLYLCQS